MNPPDTSSLPEHLKLDLPYPTEPLRAPKYVRISWQQCMEETAERTRIYLRDHYDPMERLLNKVYEPFVWIEPGTRDASPVQSPE